MIKKLFKKSLPRFKAIIVNNMGDHRIFVSIDVPTDLKNIAEAYIGSFYNQKFVKIRQQKNWYITVVFCGYLSREKLGNLTKFVEQVVSRMESFYLTPSTITFAPTGSHPRMVWVNFKNSPQFLKLNSLFSDYIDEDTLDPIPHITLAKFNKKHFDDIDHFLPENGIDILNESQSFLVESINIMESNLTPEGAEYKLLSRSSLKSG
ncbi:RNA 2',3'-cyclic phosphodiesterase [Patescibacteria group bacterium]